MKQRVYTILIILLVLAGTWSCLTTNESVTPRGQNLSYLYRPGASSLHPRFLIYHNSDTSSNLMVKVYPVELLFNQANRDGTYKAWLSIRYRVFEVGRTRYLVDSASVEYPLELEGLKKEFITTFNIRTEFNKKYIVEIITMDRLRKSAVQSFVPIDKTSETNSQNFLVMEHYSLSILFNPVVDSTLLFDVYFPKRTIDTLYVNYYKPDERIPYAPNLLISTPTNLGAPDSTWLMPYWDTIGIRINKKGIYQFLLEPSDKAGCNLYYFDEHYPSVKTPEILVDPLVYLASEREMNELKNHLNPKLAVDNFWLESSSDINRAKELIRIYYNRVLYANYYFTTFKEGWRTDRGMIYVIYGPPNSMYKTATRERWVYGHKSGRDKIEFVFNKIDSPYSQNVYRLQRGADLSSNWVQAIRSWRQGNIYILEND